MAFDHSELGIAAEHGALWHMEYGVRKGG